MSIIHLANTYFEFELSKPNQHALSSFLYSYPYCLQLQYLPLLYASKEDSIVVSEPPPYDYLNQLNQPGIDLYRSLPQFVFLDKPRIESRDQCISWGMSKNVKIWADQHGIIYAMPPWELVKSINSKIFSFVYYSSFEGSALVNNLDDLREWHRQIGSQGVLKTIFGVAGRGHLFTNRAKLEDLQSFCQEEWNCGRPLIAELWLNRLYDFSTQWTILQTGEVVLEGSTVFESDKRGVYRATLSGPSDILFREYLRYLQEHIEFVQPIMKEIAENGFFGSLGVDAFVYLSAGKKLLRPVVEINARKTLSYAALQFQKRWFPKSIIRMAFEAVDTSSIALLPTSISTRNFKQKLTFKHLG